MAVVQERNVSDVGLYVPYHATNRGQSNGLVGTLQVNAEATGTATGGAVTIQVNMRREEFGFPLIWVPTIITARDNLATAEGIFFQYSSVGNRRLNSSLTETVLALAVAGVNAAVMPNASVPIEGVDAVQAAVFEVLWATNTDTKIYHAHIFGPVYDLQVISRGGLIEPLLAGLR